MSANSINTALAELESLVNSCEQAVLRFIEEKKMKSDNSMSTHKINRKLQQNPIAIVGMASLFPQSRTLRDYWRNIINKADCITDVPDTHWSVEDYYDPNPRTPEDKTYCKRGGFIPEVDFNPMEFGIPPSILEVTDVSQLLSLVVAKEAMEDAGYGESRDFNREAVGVVLGVAMAKQLGMPLSARLEYPIWEKVLKSCGLSEEETQKIVEKIKSAYIKWDENAFPGMLANVVAGRIANRLNLGGMNCVVDAACASSFGALKVAISELVEYRSDMMLTGGVDTDNTIMAYISFSKTPAVSPSENVKPFDAKSDGMMLGEGIGMLVLKRLEDAERDGDKIYAIIKGIGTSSDGRYKSIYAPRKEGQVKALERAYDDAGFSPATVGLMEAHGTGTMAGDPTEFGSLRDFFVKYDDKKQHIALGSVKSQIGHTKAAAGAASLIKTALALHHKVLPATINITEPNPKLNIENSPFYLNTETRPWLKAEGDAPRRAGVSSFGFGGTNYHVVLEEYQAEQERPYRLHGNLSEVLLFANTPAELVTKLEATLNQLKGEGGDRHYGLLVQECQNVTIPQTAARIGFVAETRQEACKLLQIAVDLIKHKQSVDAWEHPQGIFYRASGMELGGKVVALFSGQGSQYLEMGREAVMNFPSLRRLYGQMDSLLIKDNLQPISEVVFPHPTFVEAEKNAQVAALQRTEYAQPAIGVFSAGLYSVMQQAGFKADFAAGHSFGELTALWAAGVLSEEDYLFLVKSRGQAMAAPKDPQHDAGTMLAVKEDISKIEPILKHFPQVSIANFNSPTQIVLAGPTGEIKRIHQTLQELGYGAVPLPVSAAFHTPLIAFAQKSFAIATKSVAFHAPKIPVFSNVTGKQYTPDTSAIQKTLESHLASSVLFKQEIENIYAAGGRCFVEFGPKRILTNLVKDILGDRPHLTVSLNPSTQKNSDRSLREAAVQLRVIGMALGNLDPYQLPPALPPAEPKKGLSYKLNGINYVSDKTKNAFTQALQDGFKIKGVQESVGAGLQISSTMNENFGKPARTEVQNQELVVEETVAKEVEELKSAEIQHSVTPVTSVTSGLLPTNGNGHKKTPIINTPPQPQMSPATFVNQPTTELLAQHSGEKMQTPEKPANFQQILSSLENLLTQFQHNQAENLQVHGTYLNHQMEYAKTFFQLMQQQNTLFANVKSSEEAAQIKQVVMESLERSMLQFHAQQGETLRIHEQYLREQVEYTKHFFQLIEQEYSQLIAGEGTTQPAVPLQLTETHTNTLRDFIPLQAEQAITEVAVPPAAKIVEPQPVSVIEAPAPVIEPVVKIAEPVIAAPAPIIEPEPIAPVVAFTPEPAAVSSNVKTDDIGQNLLNITSEKTGYPIEMLEYDMDMEADLGIDSIKRVEILGALQELYPNLPKPNLEELGEKRTIGQVVEYLQANASRSLSVEIAINQVQQAVEKQVTGDTSTALSASQVTEEVIGDRLQVTGDSEEYADLAQTLLNITSEKTGYPVEMLELDMDMEADLGIDSIKRVEILGAMQEAYPNLAKPNVEELGDLRTIGQIVDYLQKLAGGSEKKKPQFDVDSITIPSEMVSQRGLGGFPHERLTVELTPPSLPDPNLPRRPVKLKTLPRPDFWETTLPEGHIALITDDGSLTTSKLAIALNEQGWKVVVLSFPQSLVPDQVPLPEGVKRVTLANMREEHLQLLLQSIIAQHGPIGAFIHLHPQFSTETPGKVAYLEAEKAIVKHTFLMAKHLKASLNNSANLEGRVSFCTVAHLDGAFGLEHKGNFGVIGAGLFGLTKCLRWEWPNVFLRAIDLSPALDPHQSAQHILAELHDSNRYISEVGYGSQGRVTLIAEAE
ncbi:polyketide-type polyunsaturated fatty acid synthase PfaA [Richelia sinica FACHB-800]|uniref:Polyketide-type polyunsaturated fatty acid synthase PfaA n=1 Tax=Richelia sinica FACHB-800 TaxID=1357546 RepID=A0A975T4F8_9NOST|nr:type I polyketide synthase [Richelia sinica]MBD2663052.1 acyltransferase domain-containing protein [Richelia sinica FACHB-800]QXE21910.1 polyketide-type polyunsaturated fatty acid synthase PfaA [Richelia sinica FACHB-800]